MTKPFLIAFVFFINYAALSSSFDRVVDRKEYVFFKGLHHNVSQWKALIHKRSYEDILFLGDKPEDRSHSIAKLLRDSKLGLEVRLWSSDLFYKDRDFHVFPLYHQRKVNHQESFPFADQSFDVVMGRRLLCHCESRRTMQTCGGVDVSDSTMLLHFFSETVRVLTNKHDSFVFLHGLEPKDSQRKEAIAKSYQSVFEVMQQVEKDLFIYILYSPYKRQRRFGIYIGRSDFREWNHIRGEASDIQCEGFHQG